MVLGNCLKGFLVKIIKVDFFSTDVNRSKGKSICLPLDLEIALKCLISPFYAGPYYASDENKTPIRAGVKTAEKVDEKYERILPYQSLFPTDFSFKSN